MNIRFLVIEGNIGAGKTSLVCKMAEDLSAQTVLERFADNPFLPAFYENPERFAFPLEMSFLADRYNQLKEELMQYNLFNELIISDYYFNKSLIFAQNTLQNDEYHLYRQLFDIIHSKLPKPDLYVYLHRNIDQLIFQIKKRGREYEQQISPDYLKNIETAYFNFFKQQNEYPCIIIDIANTDFLKDNYVYESIKNIIFNNKFSVGINRIAL
ncbi:MAG: deoxynucleoside kinase [Bacteroidales bacterium]|nr:deoxynucleoside kinase [Bacteroidales bacterium]